MEKVAKGVREYAIKASLITHQHTLDKMPIKQKSTEKSSTEKQHRKKNGKHKRTKRKTNMEKGSERGVKRIDHQGQPNNKSTHP